MAREVLVPGEEAPEQAMLTLRLPADDELGGQARVVEAEDFVVFYLDAFGSPIVCASTGHEAWSGIDLRELT